MANIEILPSHQEFTFPLSEIYVAFGDGSETPAGVFYGFVLVPQANLEKGRHLIRSIKAGYGDPVAPLHCRELFAHHARNKSPWSHLSEATAITLCGDILRGVADLGLKFMAMHIPKEHFPKRFRLKGKSGHPDIVHDVDPKWMLLWGYLQLVGLFDPNIVVSPPDPIKVPSPRNQPFWAMVLSRNEAGPVVDKIIIDQETTRIRWFSKSFMWTTVAKDVRVKGPKGLSSLPVETSSREREPFLELADIFIYSIAREISGGRSLNYNDFQTEVFLLLLGAPCEEFVLGASNPTSADSLPQSGEPSP